MYTISIFEAVDNNKNSKDDQIINISILLSANNFKIFTINLVMCTSLDYYRSFYFREWKKRKEDWTKRPDRFVIRFLKNYESIACIPSRVLGKLDINEYINIVKNSYELVISGKLKNKRTFFINFIKECLDSIDKRAEKVKEEPYPLVLCNELEKFCNSL